MEDYEDGALQNKRVGSETYECASICDVPQGPFVSKELPVCCFREYCFDSMTTRLTSVNTPAAVSHVMSLLALLHGFQDVVRFRQPPVNGEVRFNAYYV